MRIGVFLQSAFRILESKAPKSFYQILGSLNNIRLRIDVGEDNQTLAFGRTGLSLIPATDTPDAFIRTNKPCIRDLVDGNMAFVEAIKNDDFYIRCPMADLGRLHQALVLFLQSSIRSTEIHELYLDYCGNDQSSINSLG